MNRNADSAMDPIEKVEDLAQELMRQLELLSGSKLQEDISYGQYKVLSVIHNQGPISVGSLGRLVGSAQSTTSEMVARLTKSGLVTKVRGPYDGRVVMVELTDQGRALMKRRRRRVREAYQTLFGKISVQEQEQLTRALGTINGILAKGVE